MFWCVHLPQRESPCLVVWCLVDMVDIFSPYHIFFHFRLLYCCSFSFLITSVTPGTHDTCTCSVYSHVTPNKNVKRTIHRLRPSRLAGISDHISQAGTLYGSQSCHTLYIVLQFRNVLKSVYTCSKQKHYPIKLRFETVKKILWDLVRLGCICSHYIQRIMLSKGVKRTIFYNITVILQYCWDKTIARSRDMYRDDSGILNMVIRCFGITNTSVQNSAIRISSVKTVPKCLRKLKVFLTNLI